jgi:hypothetical protein
MVLKNLILYLMYHVNSLALWFFRKIFKDVLACINIWKKMVFPGVAPPDPLGP